MTGKAIKGHRVQHLASIATAMHTTGADPEAILAALHKENRLRCDPPVTTVQVESVAHGAGRYDDDQLTWKPQSDTGNAEILAEAHGHHLRYVASNRDWYAYVDGRWRVDATGHAGRAAMEVARERHRVAAQIEDEDQRKALSKWARRSENATQQQGMLKLSQVVGGIALRREKFDLDPWLLSCANGTIDLRTGDLLKHNPEAMISRGNEITYDPEAECPRWLRFLDEVFAGNRETVAFVQRAVGYTLAGSSREHVLFIPYGSGRNGKGVFTEAVRPLLGGLAAAADFAKVFGVKQAAQGGAASPEHARLVGVRMVTCSEIGKGAEFDLAKVKSITGGDPVEARGVYSRTTIEYVPQYKLWISTNHLPPLDPDDPAAWARVRLIPFKVSFAGREDRTLAEALRAELPGILNWALEGCLAWQRDGLGTAPEVSSATEQYQHDEDLVLQFMEEVCHRSGSAMIGDLWNRLERWCHARGEKPPVAKKQLAAGIVKRWPSVARRNTRHGTSLDGISVEASFAFDDGDDGDDG